MEWSCSIEPILSYCQSASVEDFRLISLSNSLYLIITKVLGNRLMLRRMPSTEWQPVVENTERRLEGWQTSAVKWGSAGTTMFGPIGDSFVPSLSLLGDSGNQETLGGIDEAFTVERVWIGSET